MGEHETETPAEPTAAEVAVAAAQELVAGQEPDVWPPEDYEPVVTRLPEALAEESAARKAAEPPAESEEENV